MRKPLFPRILLITLLYFFVFIVLAALQFAGYGGTNLRVGGLVVIGQFSASEKNGLSEPYSPAEYIIDGNVHVLFGGIEFWLANGSNGNLLSVIETDGSKSELSPERMLIMEDSVVFGFSGGTELVFATFNDATELRIRGSFSDGIAGIELPFSRHRRARHINSDDGQFIISSGGMNFSFGHSPMDLERNVLFINAGRAAISYRAILERRIFSPYDFILSQALTTETYNETVTRWRDQNFPLWLRYVSLGNNEDIVVALAGEAFARGRYREAIAAVPAAFRGGPARSYESTVFLGGLQQSHRALIDAERAKIGQLSRQINAGTPDFLLETRVLEYLAVRGQQNLIQNAANFVRAMDSAKLALEILPGILEGYTDWRVLRPGTDNPFEYLAKEACQIISGVLQRSNNAPGTNPLLLEGRIYVPFGGGPEEHEFNLRLGRALMEYAQAIQNESWLRIGRSMILSALAEAGENAGSSANSAQIMARLHRVLNPVDVYPRAVPLNVPQNNIWTWTAAPSLSVTHTSNAQTEVLNIAVDFPPGETHFMIIRGIRPFVRLQLYNMNFRTDPQFEIFNSSGWSYNAQEQTLIVKMLHRSPVENIRIIFREPPPAPVVVPPPAETDETESVDA